MTDRPTRVRIVGAGRAGGSFATGLGAAGWDVELVHHDVQDPGSGVDLVLVCVPDPAVAPLVAPWPAHDDVVVAHCAGSLGLDVLAPHPRVASVHPLVSLPDPTTGARRLPSAWFGVAGDPIARSVVSALGGTAVEVADADRVVYHAAAVVASNHLVALMGQVDRLARSVGVPLEAFLSLAEGALANVVATDPATALTGPVARGDWDTVARHLDALPVDEREAYRALADLAARLVERPVGGAPAAADRDPAGEP